MTPSIMTSEPVEAVETVNEQTFSEEGILTIYRLPAQNDDSSTLAWRHMRPQRPRSGEPGETNTARDSGVPLIYLVHGAAHSGSCWLQTQRALARSGIESVAIDLRGHGFSRWSTHNAKRTQAIRYADYLDDLARVRAIGMPANRPPIVVGHSQGGILAQLHVETFPAAALVLVASPTADAYLPIIQTTSMRLLFSRTGFGMVHGLVSDMSRLFASRQRIRSLLVGRDAPSVLVEQLYAELKGTRETKYAFADVKAASARGRVPLKTTLIHLIVGTHDAFYPALAPLQRCAAANGGSLACVVGPHDLMLAGDTPSFVDQLFKVHAQADALLHASGGVRALQGIAPARHTDLPSAAVKPASLDTARSGEAVAVEVQP